MTWLLGLGGLILGAMLGALGALLVGMAKRNAWQGELSAARSRSDLLDQQCRLQLDEIARMRDALAQSQAAREQASREAAILTEQLQSKQAQFDEQRKFVESAENRLKEVFKALGADALRDNKKDFLDLANEKFKALLTGAQGDLEKKQQAIDNMVKPIRELLDKQTAAVAQLETKRESAYAKIEEQIRTIATANERLGSETAKLVSALRRPEIRGRWGELQLRNTVELAGMVDHCDFETQVTIWHGEGAQRPDMVVRLPGRGVLPVDAKVALDAYLDAVNSGDGASRSDCMARHAEQVDRHCRSLANKKYWEGFDPAHAPRMVVMFIPLESALIAALDVKPDLLSEAMKKDVVIVTPTLLIALLRAVAYGWQQQALAENADEIRMLGTELYGRLKTFAEKLDALGGKLASAVKGYNEAAGSFDVRLLPGARKLKELQRLPGDELKVTELIDVEVRPIVAAELKPLFEQALPEAVIQPAEPEAA